MAVMPPVAYDPLDPAFRADPYPTWARMAAEAPVHRWEAADAWVVVGYNTARAVLRDGEGYSTSRRYWKHHEAPADPGNRSPIERIDDHGLFSVGVSEHVRLRRLISRAFTPASIDALADRIRRRVEAHLDRLEPQGHADLVADLARLVPVQVIADYLGLDEEHAAWFHERVDALMLVTDPYLAGDDRDRCNRAVVEIEAFLEDRCAERRAHPDDGLLSRLLAVEDDGERLSHAELVSLVVSLLLAGAETTTHLISMGTATLLDHPDQLALLRAEPDLWPNAVEELLRWSYISTAVTRFTRTEVQLPVAGGEHVTVPAGELVFVAIGATLRSAVPGTPEDRLDVTRVAPDAIPFGIGSHYCLGAALARLEGRIAISAIFDRFPTLALAGRPTYNDHFVMRGLDTLPVRW